MIKLKVFLICLGVMLIVFSGITCMEVYSLERTMARSIYTDLMDDMQDIGYLDDQLAGYYRTKMSELGWVPPHGDFFTGSWPLDVNFRAHKEQQELVSLQLSIRPSLLTQWMHLLVEGEPTFQFSGRRPSEYFDQGW